MTKAAKGHEVVVNFTVRTSEGVLAGEGPQKITLGDGKVFPVIEDAIVGMSQGDEKTLTVASDDAFGPRLDELVLRIPRTQLPAGETPAKGLQLSGQNEHGETIRMVIVDISDDAVVADGNHPLAGQDLHVALSVVKISDAKV